MIRGFLYSLLLLSLVSCSKGKKINPIVIKSPAWTREYDNKNGFSSVGITTKEGSLKEKIKYAEQNGIQNLKVNIGVELENFLLKETMCLNEERRNFVVATLLSDINNNIRLKKLEDIARRDDVWRNPNNGSLYVLMVADKNLVANIVISALENIKGKYRLSPEVQQIIIDAKYDIFANKFQARKRTCNIQEKQNQKTMNKIENTKTKTNETNNATNKKDNTALQKKENLDNDKQNDFNINNIIVSGGLKENSKKKNNNENKPDNAIEEKLNSMKDRYTDEEITRIVEEAVKLADLQNEQVRKNND